MADLHPDAVLERIKELQARWKELEQSEQIPGDKHFAAAPWMWRKFSAAGRKAFEATKPFLDKRSEIQKKHLESMRALASRIVELAAEDSPDWGEMTRVVRKGRRAMRSLGEVPARARHKMAQQLKAALEKGNKALQAHYEVVEKRKLKLIHEANQLAHVADRGEAISRAKALQAEWKAAGSLWRSRENKLWSEFRQPLDPLFEDLQAEQKSIRDRREAMLADQKALCAGLESVLELEDGELLGQHGRVQGLKDAWSDFRHPDRRLQQTFSRLLDRYRERLEAQEHKAERALRDTWWEKAALLHKAESAAHAGKLTQALKTRLRKAWPAEQSGEDLDTQLEARFETALGEGPAPAPEGTAEQETARKLCICLEFLAGLPSPAQEKDLRMQYQVDRLSESLSGERKRMSAVDEAKMLEAEWLALPWIPDRDYDVFGKRIKKALKTIEQG
jgi:exonuclease SbcC